MRAIVSVVIAPATATTVKAAPTPLCETSWSARCSEPSVCIVVPTYAIVLHRAGVSLRAVASQVLRPLVATVAGGVVAVGVAVLIPDAFARLTLGAALIGLVYLVIVFPMRRLLKSPALGAA